MKTYSLIIVLFFLSFAQELHARHIAGGEMSYEYLGAGAATGSARYRITLRLFRQCETSGPALDNNANITIYQNGTNAFFRNLDVTMTNFKVLELTTPGPCIVNPPKVCYEIGSYIVETELPISAQGYTIAYQRCCRVNSLFNLLSSNVGATYVAKIPGTSLLANAPLNSTPIFVSGDTVMVCRNSEFSYSFRATDPVDGDQLFYEFEAAYSSPGGSMASIATPPPYNTVNYGLGFSSDAPMGSQVTLNRNTGLMSGIAPETGVFVVTVAVIEYRGGVEINRHRKDLHIEVANCSLASADLDIEYVNCDDYTITFQNKSNSPLISTYEWTFLREDGSTLEVKTDPIPTITFPSAGNYSVKLITNKGLACSDDGSTIAKVFPEFKAGFTVDPTCTRVPYKFSDVSTTDHGTVNYRKWFYIDPGTGLIDTSRATQPSFLFPAAGDYTVRLIVATDKGCRDTIDKNVTVLDNPPLTVNNDTIQCFWDPPIQLKATGTGTFSWSPASLLNDPTSPTPLASPSIPTNFIVKLTSVPGCVATDTVFVDVKRTVSLQMRSDTVICAGDPVTLNIASDGMKYAWTPVATLDDPSAKSPVAKPPTTTTYQVAASIGTNCIATNAVKITTIPYPTITLTPNISICNGDTISLLADGGVDFRWSPGSSLSAINIPNPLAYPRRTTNYQVAVLDDKGCPKPSFANVIVTVAPKVPAFAGRDTSVVAGQPLQLTGSGGDYYLWTPADALSNPNISNPIATLDEDVRLSLKATTLQGCYAYDTIQVKVFKTQPDIFVPTAFSPNNDGLNDKLTPIPVGIQQFDYFRIFNRWGQIVFYTNKIGEGWDGRLKALEQGNGSFVWQVRGVDYTGRVIEKKGLVTVIK